MVVAFFILPVALVNAYAIPTTGQPLGNQVPVQIGTSTGFNGDYNVGGSFENLISPFQNFFKSFQWDTSTVIDIHPTSTMMPTINITPGVGNIFTQIDGWFYGLTNIRLSGLFVIILSGLSWTLGVAKEIADWLLRVIS